MHKPSLQITRHVKKPFPASAAEGTRHCEQMPIERDDLAIHRLDCPDTFPLSILVLTSCCVVLYVCDVNSGDEGELRIVQPKINLRFARERPAAEVMAGSLVPFATYRRSCSEQCHVGEIRGVGSEERCRSQQSFELAVVWYYTTITRSIWREDVQSARKPSFRCSSFCHLILRWAVRASHCSRESAVDDSRSGSASYVLCISKTHAWRWPWTSVFRSQ